MNIDAEMMRAAEAQAVELREHGIDCHADEIILASQVSNMVESIITLKPETKTKALAALCSPAGVVHCLVLARAIPEIQAAGEDLEVAAAALSKAVVAVLANLTASHARKLSRKGRG